MARGRRKPSTITPENLGAALGHVAARLDEWKRQRGEIAAEIHHLLRSAHGLLSDLGDAAVDTAASLTPQKNKGGRPKGYKMSAATKNKLREAWKRRKAAMKAAKDKVSG